MAEASLRHVVRGGRFQLSADELDSVRGRRSAAARSGRRWCRAPRGPVLDQCPVAEPGAQRPAWQLAVPSRRRPAGGSPAHNSHLTVVGECTWSTRAGRSCSMPGGWTGSSALRPVRRLRRRDAMIGKVPLLLSDDKAGGLSRRRLAVDSRADRFRPYPDPRSTVRAASSFHLAGDYVRATDASRVRRPAR